jgi:hypothetical protein
MAPGGLLGSPAPTVPNGSGRVVYRMGPVYYTPAHADTVVNCTNLSSTSTGIALEIFDDANLRLGFVLRDSLGPGEVASFATSETAGAADATVLSGLQPIAHGKARVSATTSHLSCEAHLVIQSSEPGGGAKTTMLELVKKVAFGDD